MNIGIGERLDERATQTSRYAFVEVKAFGDLTVTARSLRDLPKDALERCALVIGPHLTDLAQALNPACSVETLRLPDNRLPAIFDLKSRGISAGLQSALSLRRALAAAAKDATFVVPRAARRERFITGGRPSVGLPPAANIYAAQERFIQEHLGVTAKTQPLVAGSRPKQLALCPFSRIAAKSLPRDIVIDLANLCHSAGLEIELLLLEGESFESLGEFDVRVIPRRFDALAAALAEYAGVISADSLPAHLAEYRGTPTFVVSPVPNRYWLPKDAFKHGHWGVFDQRAELSDRLQRFLNLAKT